MLKYIDIHSHINFAAYDEDRNEVIKRTLENDTWIINVGTKTETSEYAVKLAEEFDEGVYAIVGLHPIHSNKSFHDKEELGSEGKPFNSSGENFDYEFYKKLVAHPKVVGIGECGLDYFRTLDPAERDKQKSVFRQQVELAIEFDKPLMIHCREAYEDVLEILNEYKLDAGEKLRGNVHFFAGSLEIAKQFLDLGFTMSFTGVITFAKDYEELVKFVPMDKIMSETDCPYVTPAPHRGKRNEPIYVQEVAKKIAEIKELNEEEVREKLVENARKFWGI